MFRTLSRGIGASFLGLCLSILLLLTNSSAVDAAEQWDGRVINRIQFSATGSYSEADLLALVAMETGDLYQAPISRRAVKALYETGQFNSIWISVTAIGETRLSLVFELEEKKFLSQIEVKKNRSLSDDEIIETLAISSETWFNASTLGPALENIRTRYRNEGYFRAKIGAELLPLPGQTQKVKAIITVQENTRTKIGALHFIGETRIPLWLLRLQLYSNSGEYYLLEELQKDLAHLREYYEARGYYKAVIGPIAVNHQEQSNTVDIDITIVPGKRIDVVFVGGEAVDESTLRSLILIEKERSADIGVLESSARQITRHFRELGYPFAETTFKLNSYANKKHIEVVFTIESHYQAELRAIHFSGNFIFQDAILEKRLFFPNVGWLRKSIYSESQAEKATGALKQFYRNEGFQAAKISHTVFFDAEEEQATVLFDINEGVQTKIKTIKIEGNLALSEALLIAETTLVLDSPYTEKKMRAAKTTLRSSYSKAGYIDAKIQSRVTFSPQKTEAALGYQVTEGSKYEIGEIQIVRPLAGEPQLFTQDEVLIRAFSISSGSPYNPIAILETQNRLYRTGHFSSVRFEAKTAAENSKVKNLFLHLTERPRIGLEFGLGYGDREGLRGFIEASHDNLWGTSQSLTSRAIVSRVEEKYSLIYRKPWLWLESITGRVTASYLRLQEISFDLESFSIVFGVDKKFSTRLSGALLYQIERKKITNVAEDARLSKEDRRQTPFVVGSLNPSLVYDTRDDPFNPRSGSVNSIVLRDAAQILGSEVQLVKVSLRRRSFHSLSPKALFAFSLRIGLADRFGETEETPISERFFIGGRNTVRGYVEDGLGLTGDTFVNGEPLGGNAMLVLNEELRFTLPRSFGLVLFFDHGNVWSRMDGVVLSDLKSTAGLGLRYNTPIGPFRLDWGYKLNREGSESPSAFHFTLGHAF